MNQNDLENIINLVTQQVMAALDNRSCPAGTEGYDKILVVGKSDAAVPEELCRSSVLLDLADYGTHKNILRYSKVIVSELSITQLADIALGRPADEASCAVIYALLSGVEVIMLEDALSFRRFAGKGSNGLYNLLEQYAKTLQVFGVKTYTPKPKPVIPEAKPAKFAPAPVEIPAGSAKPNASRLITETEARQLLAQGNPVRLPAGAIVTPLAKDVFSAAGVTVIRD